jgi:hypothetical protein
MTDEPKPKQLDLPLPNVAEKRDTRFKPGHVPPVRRQKGTRNKITRDLKDGIIHGAVVHGSDGRGKGGLWGYLEMCARRFPKEYLWLLARLLPLDLRAKPGEFVTEVGRRRSRSSGPDGRDSLAAITAIVGTEVGAPSAVARHPLPLLDPLRRNPESTKALRAADLVGAGGLHEVVGQAVACRPSPAVDQSAGFRHRPRSCPGWEAGVWQALSRRRVTLVIT